jgi:SAM-dependent methyltransferase
MFVERNRNSLPHNWLLHHYYISSLKKNAGHLQGLVLDLGCGRKPFRDIIEKNCRKYIGLEYPATLHGLDDVEVIGNALILPFLNESLDTVVSFSVLEHVTEPQQLLEEAFRALKRGGKALLMTPLMWGEHEPPHDYFRFTRYGLRYLATKAGFEVVSIEPDTGYWSTAVLRFNYSMNRLARGPLRYLLRPRWWNQYLALWLDKLDRNYRVDTATYTTILRKPE